jgi:hypothetical protein
LLRSQIVEDARKAAGEAPDVTVRPRKQQSFEASLAKDRIQPEAVIDSTGSVAVNCWQISVDHCTHGVLSHAHDYRFTLWPP